MREGDPVYILKLPFRQSPLQTLRLSPLHPGLLPVPPKNQRISSTAMYIVTYKLTCWYYDLHCVSEKNVTLFTRTWRRYVRVFAVAIPSDVWRLSSVCLSVVCNVGAPYSGGWSFRQYFFTAVYASHPLTSVQNFTEIVPGEPLRRKR